MLKVNTVATRNQCEALKQILKRLNEVAQDVNSINQRLSWDVAVSDQVRQVLGQHSENLIQLSDQANTLHTVLMDAMARYEEVEQRNSGGGKGAVQTGASGQGSGGGGLRDEDEEIDWKEELEQIKKLLSLLEKLLGDNEAGLLSGLIGMLLSILKLKGLSDKEFEEIFYLLAQVPKKGAGALKFLYKLLGQKGKAAIAGVVGSVIGLFAEVEKLQGADFFEQLRNSGKAVESCAKLVQSMYTAMGGKAPISIRMWVAAIGSLSHAGLSLVGEVAGYWEDGYLSWAEIGQSGVTASTNGMATMQNILSGGDIIEADGTSIAEIYNRYAKEAGAWVGEHANNTVEQIALTIPATSVAFIKGLQENYEAFIKDIQENMENYRGKFLNLFTETL